MKILFVCSGNVTDGQKKSALIIKPAVHQGDSLIRMGYNVSYYFIKGKGVFGYVKNIPQINRVIKLGKYQVIHAHYSLSAIATTFATSKKIIVSLMGSDIYSKLPMKLVVRLFGKYLWRKVIVKSLEMQALLKLKNSIVIPNGVDLSVFKPLDKAECRKKLNIAMDKRIIIFVADPNRNEKNFKLAQEAITLLNDYNIILIPVYNVKHEMMPIYMNAADVLLLTSLWEGSVNVVKEAIACDLNIVSTDVGDVKRNIEGLPGNYISSFEPEDISKKILLALKNPTTGGHSRIIKLLLDSQSTNKRLIEIYNESI